MKQFHIFETIGMALDAIKQNKLRAFLASLGVVIGISFVILMGWSLAGLDSVLQDTINLIGSDMLYVDKWDWSGGKNWKLLMQRKPIAFHQALELCSRVKSAEVAIPVADKWGTTIKFENETAQNMTICGTFSEYGVLPSAALTDGRFFNKIEEQYGSNVVVIGWGVYNTFFQEKKGGSPIGKELNIEGHKFTIIGVIKKQGTLLLDFIDNQVFVPLHSFLGCFGRYNRSFEVALKAGSVDKLDVLRAETEGIMREIRNINPGQSNDFSINETKAFEENVKTFRLYVWGIGIGMTVLSFIVGMIGIMNIMFVSVAERTKEIGIRKAIGAPKRSILLQFLVESSALCFAGAVFSFILCSILIFLAATFLPKLSPSLSFLSPIIPFNLLIISSAVSISVGVLAGLIPAVRAARLDPVDALRYE